MLTKKDIFAKSSFIAWAIAVGAYFFQFPFSKLSSLILPFLFIYIALQIPNIKIPKNKVYLSLLALFVVFMCFQGIRAIVLGISFSRILRFAAILTVIPFSCFIKDENFNQKKELFLNLAMIKSIILIFIGTIIVHDGDFRVFRDWAYSFGLGDIYFLNRFIPKVQVHGNALLVIAFMLDCLSDKKITKRKILLLLGVLVAGNFAFILALLAFIAWQAGTFAIKLAKRNKYVKYISIAVIIIAVAVLVPYFISKIVEKAATSNAVRLEQAKVFLDANPFIGDGLGCWVTAQTEHLSYNGEIYFELQTLYIFKQVGIITLLLFYAVTLIPMYYAGKNRFIFYLIYLFFSFWNPYCFDVTQIITIILAINISQLGEVNDKIAYYSIPSGLLRQRKHS